MASTIKRRFSPRKKREDLVTHHAGLDPLDWREPERIALYDGDCGKAFFVGDATQKTASGFMSSEAMVKPGESFHAINSETA